ncbi:MAG: thiamine phosphate synthase, partial [Chloroflexota bacterium]|nr:thiamine phosphate synthase [Chloroflexota bacterium]
MLRPSAEGLRLADANRNRLREGLRVLEDVARFVLEDAGLTQRLKGLRHDLAGGSGEALRRAQDTALLGARRAGEDVGAFAENADEARRPDMASLVMANARRAQESLRVLEELGKLPGWGHAPDSDTCKRARFALYEVEQTLVSRVLRQEKRGKVRGLYVILDPQQTKGRAEAEVARAALRGG